MAFLDEASSASSYYKLTRGGQVFFANATVTSPVTYATAAGMGGPLLWNNSGPTGGGTGPRVMAVLLAVGVGWTTAPGSSGTLGITTGQTAAPTSTTAIDGVSPANQGTQNARQCSVFRVGTVTNAGTSFIATHAISTAATPVVPTIIPLDGLIQVPPGCWASICAGHVALTTMVGDLTLVWAEVPF